MHNATFVATHEKKLWYRFAKRRLVCRIFHSSGSYFGSKTCKIGRTSRTQTTQSVMPFFWDVLVTESLKVPGAQSYFEEPSAHRVRPIRARQVDPWTFFEPAMRRLGCTACLPVECSNSMYIIVIYIYIYMMRSVDQLSCHSYTCSTMFEFQPHLHLQSPSWDWREGDGRRRCLPSTRTNLWALDYWMAGMVIVCCDPRLCLLPA